VKRSRPATVRLSTAGRARCMPRARCDGERRVRDDVDLGGGENSWLSAISGWMASREITARPRREAEIDAGIAGQLVACGRCAWPIGWQGGDLGADLGATVQDRGAKW